MCMFRMMFKTILLCLCMAACNGNDSVKDTNDTARDMPIL